MMKKITKRDVFAFFLGIVFCFLLDVILNWDQHAKAAKEGLKDGSTSAQIENKN